ncbi:MAG: hypothetical protein U0325_29085 [Polyangiales bacterium]
MNAHRRSLALTLALAACASPRPAPVTAPAAPRADAARSVDAAADASIDAPAATTDALRACGPGESPLPEVAAPPEPLGSARWAVRGDVATLPAAVGRVCAQLAARARAARAPLAALIGGLDQGAVERFDEIGACHAAGGGAWVLLPGAGGRRTLRAGSSGTNMVVARLAWTLGFVRADGTVLRASDPRARGAAHSGDERGDGAVKLVYDYDHDGVAEVLLESSAGNVLRDAVPTTWGRLFAVRDNAIVPMPGAPEGEIEAPFDVDADGIPDLLLRSPWAAGNTCGPSTFYGPLELAHARPDGTFARDDAHARAWMRQRCAGGETTPTTLFPSDGPEGELPYRVACWRYWGATADALRAAGRASWSDDADDHCTSREMVFEGFDLAPRFTLQTPCAAPSTPARGAR